MEVTTRAAAKKLGLKKYFSGLPCPSGHITERYVVKHLCVTCAAQRSKNYQAKKPRKKHKRTPEGILREKQRKKTKAYLLKQTEFNRNWRRRNPEKMREIYSNKRARKKNAAGQHTAAEIQQMLVDQKFRCANPICKKSLVFRYHADHIMPLVLGGSNWIENIQLLCQPCNNQKHAKPPEQWRSEIGWLA